ncbi:MAG: hypothetical protein KatS3mg102_0609 [Planctomycetota bacterium]|nr:MAG: hypothetical protein KatS3mg102_0609 [Planctomycetota bacterium]
MSEPAGTLAAGVAPAGRLRRAGGLGSAGRGRGAGGAVAWGGKTMRLPALGTLCRYQVEGRPGGGIEAVVERLERNRFLPLEEAVEEEERTGWITVEHLLDTAFRPEKVQLGPYLVFALRRDRRRVPAALLRAHLRMEELAHQSVAGRPFGARQRREVKARLRDELIRKVLPAAASWPVVWRPRERLLWFGTLAAKANELFAALFERTFELKLSPLGPAALARRLGGEAPELAARLAALRPAVLHAPAPAEPAPAPALAGVA